ncbi:UDP-glucose-glycoprotein glucosyltransferase isoform X2 [Oratosquilla oratoria]|uniref:UDP-glucose-glycoprotein glucosyltransferase isoform X2 n=1 Tax=Oratosquilla oratoria TaxID=337810 RepID=UPI003F776F60
MALEKQGKTVSGLALHLLPLMLMCLFPLETKCQTKQKPVTTFLNSKWSDTPLLLETAEYLNEENPTHFWGFVNSVAELDPDFLDYKNDRERLDVGLSEASQFLSLSQISLLKLSLSMRVMSPKIEMFRQVAFTRGLPEDCEAVVDVNGKLTCSVEELAKLIEKGDGSKPFIYHLDHHYPGSEKGQIGVVLYGELGTAAFRDFHEALKPYASSGKIDYVLRHYVKEPSGRRVRLSGYGVELQIKSTEYKNQDDTEIKEEGAEHELDEEQEQEVEGFVFSKLKELYPENVADLKNLQQHLTESTHEMAPMKVWQLQHLSMQAAQRIMTAPNEEALNLLVHIAQNFPTLARSLTKTKVNDKMKREILKNQNTFRTNLDINPPDAALFVNGMYFDMDFTDMFTLLEYIRNEQRVMEGLHKLGVSGPALRALLNLDASESKEAYGVDIRDSSVMWLSDIEKDRAYRKWPASVNELLRPTYPGMIRNLRKNFFNLVIFMEPAKAYASGLLTLAQSFYDMNAPVRIGLVFVVDPDPVITGYVDAGVAMLCAFNYITLNKAGQEEANYKGLLFLAEIHNKVGGEVTVSDVTAAFKSEFPSVDLDDVFGEDSDYDTGRKLAKEFSTKAGFSSFPQALMNGIPLPEKHVNGDEMEEAVLTEVMHTTRNLQHSVYKGELTDKDVVIDWLMAKPNIMPRLNKRILHQDTSTFIDLTGFSNVELTSETFVTLSASDMTAAMMRSRRYMSLKNDASVRPLTVWVAGDFDTPEGRQLLKEAIQYCRESNSVRVGVIQNPKGEVSETSHPISYAVEVAMATLPPVTARLFLGKILSKDNAEALLLGKKKMTNFEIPGMDMEAFQSRLKSLKPDTIKAQSLYASKVLNLARGQRTVIANGRMIGALESEESFVSEDMALLERIFTGSFGDKIAETIEEHQFGKDASDLIMQITAVLQTKPQSKPRHTLPHRSEEHSVIHIAPKVPEQPAFDIVGVFDPVSKAAQKVGPILMVLQEVVNAQIRVFLNAQEKHSEMPLKSYFRYVLEPEPQFTTEGDLTSGPLAKFTSLPASPILTQNYHVPENWLVESVKSIYDLDNIKLETVESGVHSEFELEYLLLEGHCFEQSSGNPPRGLQFTLGTHRNPVMVDTIVMANLGYWQLKANPGAWLLRLRQGRSSEIYDVVSHEGTDTPKGSEDVQVVMSSFKSQVVKVRVAKKPGMQNVELLQEEENTGGLWNSITSTFSSSAGEEPEETVNVFSLASGHLYERLMRIMIASVCRQTKAPVKFWFLKNFLSPSFKDSLPVLAKHFGFDYEFVQYKWPRWLHQQTEKQRIIWGYKILFLDVMFPLDVKKIIFVDADQVVRGDLTDLRDLDLEGAPYAYTPFCDSRKEMEGFRFWKQGYWRNHLAGRKYHISAMFVIDLKKFRRVAAGDRLRGQYQGLSQDPNSLSNLDQDLPNNMIHQVRIKSLPQEWLWCETWCDDSSKRYAKIIDLCNNPLTKEGKLDAAQRIIPEWIEYDNEVKGILAEKEKSQSTPNGSHKHTEL